MNRKIAAVGIAVLAIGQLLIVPSAWAQKKTSPPVIAVVDVQAVMQSAEAPKGIRAQMQKAQASFQQSLQGKNDELKKVDQDLQQQRTVLAPDAFQQRQREFEQKVEAAQRDIQERRGKLEGAFNGATQQVETAVVQVVSQIAGESGVTVVLSKSAAIYVAADLDITKEVVKRLNSKLPSVNVAIPK